ncbi:MAG: VWA domain-containing protein [Desulfitobacteriaceae bacterium]
MSIRQELRQSLAEKLKTKSFNQDLMIGNFYVSAKNRWDLVTSILTGHHILIVGPTGCGKTTLALGIAELLGSHTVAEDCPMSCAPTHNDCPWCQVKGNSGKKVKIGLERAVRIQASYQLSAEELMGGPDPEMVLKYGLKDIRAFLPGKILRAQHGILIIDGLDQLSGSTQSILRYFLEGELVLPEYDEIIPMDTVVVATVTPEGLTRLDGSMRDHFDVVKLDYLESYSEEMKLLPAINQDLAKKAIEIVRQTRQDLRLERGASSRALIQLANVINSFELMGGNSSVVERFSKAVQLALPHRIRLDASVKGTISREQVVEEHLRQLWGNVKQVRNDVAPYLPPEALANLAEQIAMNEEFRKALSKGHLRTFLQLVKNNPTSEIAKLYHQIMQELISRGDFQEAGETAIKKLELEAVKLSIEKLEEEHIFERDADGWRLAEQGVALLIKRLTPQFSLSQEGGDAEGNHKVRRITARVDGKVIGVRPFVLGDCYRDLALRETLRQAIKHQHREVHRKDIQIQQREKRVRVDVILCIDVSGTMAQLEKYWLSKRIAMQLGLTYLNHGDQVGVVAFANDAVRISKLTNNKHHLTKNILGLEISSNSFTNIGAGLEMAGRTLAYSGGKSGGSQVIVISDGEATAPRDNPEQFVIKQASSLRRQGILVTTVCLNEKNANPLLMRKVAKVAGGRFYLLDGEGFSLGNDRITDR